MNGMKTGMSSHQRLVGGSDVWLTPRHVLEALGDFDLDPCAAPQPHLWPTAREHITLPFDGLAEAWHGRVWCNPPYGQHTWLWLDRLAMHGTGTALVFARTETTGFVDTVWGAAAGVMFLHGRLDFHRADGSKGANAGAPSCLVAYGLQDADILQHCGLPGTYVSGWR